ncbi:MAG: transposase [Phycisphaerae bacterium]
MSNARRHYTGAEKMAILREHLLEKTPISDLCQKHGITPDMFYVNEFADRLKQHNMKVFEDLFA